MITPVFGASRDNYGSYVPGLYLCGIALMIIAVLFLTLGPYPVTAPDYAKEPALE